MMIVIRPPRKIARQLCSACKNLSVKVESLLATIRLAIGSSQDRLLRFRVELCKMYESRTGPRVSFTRSIRIWKQISKVLADLPGAWNSLEQLTATPVR